MMPKSIMRKAILKTNILIATFDKHEFWPITTSKHNHPIILPSNDVDFSNEYNRMHYDSEWNWLMPVIQKIYRRACKQMTVLLELAFHNIKTELITGEIARVYPTVIKFIEQYNQEYKQ